MPSQDPISLLDTPIEVLRGDPELLAEYQKTLLQETENRKRSNPLRYFVPNGAQEERTQLKSLVNVFSTGNGVGKTALGCNIVGNLILGPQNKFFDLPEYRDFMRPSQGRVVSTPTGIENTIVPELKRWLPPNTYQTRKASKQFDSLWEFKNGSHFNIMTYEQDKSEFEGPTLQWVWFDEPPPEEIFGACVSRLRKGGYIIMTMTPLTGAVWVFDRLNDPWQSKEQSWSIIWADIEANCRQHGTRGVLEHHNIERMTAEYPPEEREARLSGKPLYLEGRIFPTFNRDVHCVPRETIEQKLKEPHTKYMVVDPHDRKPFAIGWCLVDETDDIYWFDEWPNEPFISCKTNNQIEDYVELIKSKENNAKIEGRIIDARYGNRASVQAGKTIRDEFDEHDMTFHNSYTDNNASISAGHIKVREYLAYDKDLPLCTTNKPKMYFADDCLNLVYGMMNYTYDEFRRKDQGTKEKPRELHKDFPDLVRYMVMDDPTHIPEVDQIIYQPPPERWQKAWDHA